MIRTGIAGLPSEHFLPRRFKRYSDEWEVSDYLEYLDMLKEKTITPNGVFGVKLMWPEMEFLLHECRQFPKFKDMTPIQLLRELFPNPRFIFMTRRDKIRQAVSREKLRQTRVSSVYGGPFQARLSKVHYDYWAVRKWIDLVHEEESRWRAFFDQAGIKPLQINYEELASDVNQTLLAVLDHLGIPVPERLFEEKRRLVKLSDSLSEQWVNHYRRAERFRNWFPLIAAISERVHRWHTQERFHRLRRGCVYYLTKAKYLYQPIPLPKWQFLVRDLPLEELLQKGIVEETRYHDAIYYRIRGLKNGADGIDVAGAMAQLTRSASSLSNKLRWVARPLRRDVYFVTGQQWAYFWDAHYLMENLRSKAGLRVYVTNKPWELRLKRQMIYFAARQKFFRLPPGSMDPSNDIFLLWPHGDPRFLESVFQEGYQNIAEMAKHLRKIVVTCSISRDALMALGIPSEKIALIPFGVDLDLFRIAEKPQRQSIRRTLGIPPDAICIGSFQKDGLGWGEGLSPKEIKGPDVFLEVLQILSRTYPNLFVLLTGPARGFIKRGLERIGIPCVHHYFQGKDYSKIVRFYHALDYYLITSRSEGGPLSFLESWATGAAVVSSRVGIPADAIRHQENGMLADIEDTRALADHLSHLIEDRSLRDRCCLRALEDVKRYGWPEIALEHFQQLYKPCLC